MALEIPVQDLIPIDNEKEMIQSHFFSATANWVIPNKLMAGESPSNPTNVRETKDAMFALRLDGKITTFVCLQAEVPPQTSDEDCVDFGGVKLSCSQHGEVVPTGQANKTVKIILPSYADMARNVPNVPRPKFVYYGIKDDGVVESLEGLDVLIQDLVKRVEDGEVLYIHCTAGRGRTGVVVSSILGQLYPNLSAEEVLERINTYYAVRSKGAGKWVNPSMRSPETESQCQQVKDYLKFSSQKNAECGCVTH